MRWSKKHTIWPQHPGLKPDTVFLLQLLLFSISQKCQKWQRNLTKSHWNKLSTECNSYLSPSCFLKHYSLSVHVSSAVLIYVADVVAMECISPLDGSRELYQQTSYMTADRRSSFMSKCSPSCFDHRKCSYLMTCQVPMKEKQITHVAHDTHNTVFSMRENYI